MSISKATFIWDDWSKNPMEYDYHIQNRDSQNIDEESTKRFLKFMAGKRDNAINFNPKRLHIAGIPKSFSDVAFINYLVDIECPQPLNRVRLFRGQMKSTEDGYSYAFLDYDNINDARTAMHLLHLQRQYSLRVNYAIRRHENETKHKRTVEIKDELINKNESLNADNGSKSNTRFNANGDCSEESVILNDFFESPSKGEKQESTDSGVSESISGNGSQLSSRIGSGKNSCFDSSGDESTAEDDSQEVKNSSTKRNCGGDIPLNFLELIVTGELVKMLPTLHAKCCTCSNTPFIDHVHYIIDEQRIVNPIESLPALVKGYCHQCGVNTTIDWQFCANCRQAMYCSDACQILDWSRHAKECASLKH